MADSNSGRGSVRASARKATRKSTTGTPPKGASKARQSAARSKDLEVTPAPAKTPAAAPHPAAPHPAGPHPAGPRVAATIPVAERLRMIAEAAYYRAQRRGLAPGDPQRDWLEAEAEIDAMLLRRLSDG